MQRLEYFYKKTGSLLSRTLNTVTSFAKILIQSKLNLKSHQPANTNKCIILGNGPSLATSLEVYNSKFADYTLLCVNLFALNKEYELLKPKFYVMHDPALWKSEGDLTKRIATAIKEKTSWPIKIFFPFKSRNSKFIQDLNSEHVEVVYYNYTIFKGFNAISNYVFKRNLAMPQSQNVLVACLYLCINMGFKETYLLGADHTWHENLMVDENNVLCITDVHFYDRDQKINARPFYKGLYTKETFSVAEIFENWTKVFKGYEAISKYAAFRKVKIFNASHVSFIDAFERREIS
jgi:hypothetical protein